MLRDKRLIQSELLATRWLRGDELAFEGIVRLWERSLFYYLRRLLDHEPDAWEVLQDTWLNVLKSRKSLRDPAAFPAFLYRSARNAALSRLRKRGLTIDAAPGDLPDPSTDDACFTAFDNAEQVHHALDQLQFAHREVLTLFFLNELSLEEIATLLGIPTGTVKSRLHYARRAIRQALTDGGHHVPAK